MDQGGEDVGELWRRVRERMGGEDNGSGEERIAAICKPTFRGLGNGNRHGPVRGHYAQSCFVYGLNP